ncbi:TetR/AcrR family transcriptional regulator [Neobacillus rhizosphaerae]|uniref:TetR/AcrR family transcriptional regulator n=1 Tax=Neobacillus rhizosphaerae TaxID=2880965 RepID=UPI003D2E441D
MIDYKNISKKQQHTVMDFYFVLADMTAKNGYSMLSISEIVSHSGYNRATFYKYFKNKQDLANSFVEYLSHEFYQECLHPFNEKEQINFNRMKPQEFTIFHHILKHSHYYRLLIVNDTVPKLQSSIIETIITILQNELLFANFQDSSPIFNSNAFYKAYGFYGLIHEWIKSDFQISPNLIMKDLLTIFTTDNSKANIQSSFSNSL